MNIIIIGGGIVGFSIARELLLSSPGISKTITILEKDQICGSHATTRNSGVMHAGFYYSQESHKAKFCSTANRLLRDYFVKNNLIYKAAGKVVVTKDHKDEEFLDILYARGKDNGCDLQLLGKSSLPKIEPFAKTYDRFLWSPNTWSGSPTNFFTTLKREIEELGVSIITSAKVIDITAKKVYLADNSCYSFDYLINAAGGFALKLANKLDLGKDLLLLPFKGLYLKTQEHCSVFLRHIYPVPNISQPFLGVHTTVTADGYLKLGPTAIPVFSPENYQLFSGLDITVTPSILRTQLSCLLLNSFGFRDLALSEYKFLFKNNIISEAQNLTTFDLSSLNFEWYSPGIRPQLYNRLSDKLEMDFLFEQTDSSFHLLNSISPAWTCCFATAKHVVNLINI